MPSVSRMFHWFPAMSVRGAAYQNTEVDTFVWGKFMSLRFSFLWLFKNLFSKIGPWACITDPPLRKPLTYPWFHSNNEPGALYCWIANPLRWGRKTCFFCSFFPFDWTCNEKSYVAWKTKSSLCSRPTVYPVDVKKNEYATAILYSALAFELYFRDQVSYSIHKSGQTSRASWASATPRPCDWFISLPEIFLVDDWA